MKKAKFWFRYYDHLEKSKISENVQMMISILSFASYFVVEWNLNNLYSFFQIDVTKNGKEEMKQNTFLKVDTIALVILIICGLPGHRGGIGSYRIWIFLSNPTRIRSKTIGSTGRITWPGLVRIIYQIGLWAERWWEKNVCLIESTLYI